MPDIQLNSHLKMGSRSDSPWTPDRLAYLRRLGSLLGSPFRVMADSNGEKAPGAALEQTEKMAERLDLLLYWEPEKAWWMRLLGLTSSIRIVARARSSILLLREPRWPLRRILLIMRDHESDNPALDWVCRFARPNRIEVFILPIVPPIPAMYRYDSLPLRPDLQLAELMISSDLLARVSETLTLAGARGTLLLHDRSPRRRIEWAAAACDPDLVVIGAEPFPIIQRRLFGELERPLILSQIRPLLVAKGLQNRPA